MENRERPMPQTRKNHPPSLKARVAIEAIMGHKTTAQIAQPYAVHPTQIGFWKRQAMAGLPDVFGNGREQMRQQADTEKAELYQQIEQLKVELDFSKTKSRIARLRSGGHGSTRNIFCLSRCNANCWACRDRATTSSRGARARRTWG